MSAPARYRPCDELVEVLAPAFAPCAQFTAACIGIASWDPARGHIPRGFIGAFGDLDDVEAVLIVAEPGDPLPGERHDLTGDPITDIEDLCRYVYEAYAERRSQFHRNVRDLLDRSYPRQSLSEQLRRVWITESVLCSAPVESGRIARSCEDACVSNYLAAQLALLPGRPHIPFGGKARNRTSRHGLARQSQTFRALAPPGSRPASRENAAELIRSRAGRA